MCSLEVSVFIGSECVHLRWVCSLQVGGVIESECECDDVEEVQSNILTKINKLGVLPYKQINQGTYLIY